MIDRSKRDAEIARRVRNGEIPDRIGYDYGLSKQRVYQICRALGIKFLGLPQRRSRALEERVSRLIRDGFSNRATAKQLGISISHVSHLKDRAGLIKPKGQPRLLMAAALIGQGKLTATEIGRLTLTDRMVVAALKWKLLHKGLRINMPDGRANRYKQKAGADERSPTCP